MDLGPTGVRMGTHLYDLAPPSYKSDLQTESYDFTIPGSVVNTAT